MQEIRSSNSPVVTRICDPNRSRARHHGNRDLNTRFTAKWTDSKEKEEDPSEKEDPSFIINLGRITFQFKPKNFSILCMKRLITEGMWRKTFSLFSRLKNLVNHKATVYNLVLVKNTIKKGNFSWKKSPLHTRWSLNF